MMRLAALNFLLQLPLEVLIALSFCLHEAIVQLLQLLIAFTEVVVGAAANWIHDYVL